VRLTIFTSPKPFSRGHIRIIQRNAIRSWLRLRPEPKIILFGNDEGVMDISQELGLIHVPDVATSPQGTPLISDMFRRAEAVAEGNILVFANADMMLFQSLAEAGAILREGFQQFLAVGQRYDLDIKEELYFDGLDDLKRLNDLVKAQGELHSPSGMDWMMFTKELWPSIPDFIIGRAAWDGALLSRTLRANIPVVDATEYVLAIHQNHDYGHLRGDWQEAWDGPEAKRNRDLAEPFPYIVNLWYSTYRLLRSGAVLKKSHPPPLPDRTVNDPGGAMITQGRQFPPAAVHNQRAFIAPSNAPVPTVPPIFVDTIEPWSIKKHFPITIFTCPKPFNERFGTIQDNAIASWTLLSPTPEIILFGDDDDGIEDAAARHGCIHVKKLRKSGGGAPYVTYVFKEAEERANGGLLAWINCDIILGQAPGRSFLDVVLRVADHLPEFLMIGRRWHVDLGGKTVNFRRGRWWSDLRKLVHRSGKLDSPDALDYFVFTPGLWGKLPPLRLGRAAYDGALIELALKAKKPIVDATDATFVVHQAHDYSHVDGGRDTVWNGPDAQRNRKLVPGWARDIRHATHKVTSGGVIKKG
jgi:hypothetical protein